MAGRNVVPENAGTERYSEVLQRISQTGECPFCENNLFREHSEPVVVQNEFWLVTKNQYSYPAAEIKLLIIFRDHITSFLDLPEVAWTDLYSIYKRLIQDCGFTGSTLLMRQGDPTRTGGSVEHLHFHVIVGNGMAGEENKVFARVG
jgi:diadenosine tetraphosphate (Ap4A) HIT family hydrolase